MSVQIIPHRSFTEEEMFIIDSLEELMNTLATDKGVDVNQLQAADIGSLFAPLQQLLSLRAEGEWE